MALHETRMETSMVELPNGLEMEVMTCQGSSKNPIVFWHGSFHSAWCWAEHYLAFFASKGYTCMAVSQRGVGKTRSKQKDNDEEEYKELQLMTLVDDLKLFLQHAQNKYSSKPFLVAHSLGGFIAMKYMVEYPQHAKTSLSGVGLVCCLPPVGAGPMTSRLVKSRSFLHIWRLVRGMMMKRFVTDKVLCRAMFFGGTDSGISDEQLTAYQEHFARDTQISLSAQDLDRNVPLQSDKDGKAPFLSEVTHVFVLGATRDFLVDEEAVQETATYMGVEPVLVDSPHDIMLGKNWKNGANAILDWIQQT